MKRFSIGACALGLLWSVASAEEAIKHAKLDFNTLNKNKIGDVPYHPLSIYSMIIDNNPSALMLFRSFIVSLIDKSEKIIPTVTPENLRDDYPLMLPLGL